MFFRRRVVDDGLHFNFQRKAIANAEFVIELIRKGYSIPNISRYVSVFTLTESNLGASGSAKKELAEAGK